ncbi:uncharacterized protein LOC132544878 [Ylistrum balloti]|uniref:uncharacterized protein LOC132544878 n=1 Tax=Ylistrum balloti TaxID=509963 RepID=UPI0029059459|nr:uncharacterized protein LOC132544878 [Ylistrum balloti]
MSWNIVLLVLAAVLLYNGAEAIMCHRCYSAMGGCGDDLSWWMFPWKDCGDSRFCVKVIEKVGSDHTIIRECENNLLKTTKHRLQMPGLRRHGYCLPARKNSGSSPLTVEDPNIQYCFCNDWNGCNTAHGLSVRFLPVSIVAVLVTVFISKFF